VLENGDEFFPRVFQCIKEAKRDVLIETFIFFADEVGKQLRDVLVETARKGVHVCVTVDGYGSPDLTAEFIASMATEGVHFQIFDPRPKLLGMRTNLFRRLHRKIVVIDGTRAFIGGINFSEDHLIESGSTAPSHAKQDYSVEIEGPVVEEIHLFAQSAFRQKDNLQDPHRPWYRRHSKSVVQNGSNGSNGARVLFVTRDNEQHQEDIEKHYLTGIRKARHKLIIANAYFFPGYRLFRAIRNAARRGVEVVLILPGKTDIAIARIGALMLYDHLLKAGVRIYECQQWEYHGKVAVIDDEWATVGSSNLDPLSLSLNLEANLIIRDRDFNHQLETRLRALAQDSCMQVAALLAPKRTLWRVLLGIFVFHLLRHFPRWAVRLPKRTPKLNIVHKSKNIVEKINHA
jgi:cardiolipin synthase